jgi:hypothetical protein
MEIMKIQQNVFQVVWVREQKVTNKTDFYAAFFIYLFIQDTVSFSAATNIRSITVMQNFQRMCNSRSERSTHQISYLPQRVGEEECQINLSVKEVDSVIHSFLMYLTIEPKYETMYR